MSDNLKTLAIVAASPFFFLLALLDLISRWLVAAWGEIGEWWEDWVDVAREASLRRDV